MDLFGEWTQRTTAWAFFGLALAYAFFAGLRNWHPRRVRRQNL
jgi:hypothetical protein